MDHGRSLPHTHSDVEAIFNHMDALTTSVTPVMVCKIVDENDEEDEEQEKEYTYMVISIDVKNVPTPLIETMSQTSIATPIKTETLNKNESQATSGMDKRNLATARALLTGGKKAFVKKLEELQGEKNIPYSELRYLYG